MKQLKMFQVLLNGQVFSKLYKGKGYAKACITTHAHYRKRAFISYPMGNNPSGDLWEIVEYDLVQANIYRRGEAGY